jgi:hypothetical protein
MSTRKLVELQKKVERLEQNDFELINQLKKNYSSKKSRLDINRVLELYNELLDEILKNETLKEFFKETIFENIKFTNKFFYKGLLENENFSNFRENEHFNEIVVKEYFEKNKFENSLELVEKFFFKRKIFLQKLIESGKIKEYENIRKLWKNYTNYIIKNIFNYIYKYTERLSKKYSIPHSELLSFSIEKILEFLLRIDPIELKHKKIISNNTKKELTIFFDLLNTHLQTSIRDYFTNNFMFVKLDRRDLLALTELNKYIAIFETLIYEILKEYFLKDNPHLQFSEEFEKYIETLKEINNKSNSSSITMIKYIEKLDEIKNTILENIKDNLDEFINELFEKNIIYINTSKQEISLNKSSLIRFIYEKYLKHNEKFEHIKSVNELLKIYSLEKRFRNFNDLDSINKTILSIDNLVHFNFLDGSKTIDDYLGGTHLENNLDIDFVNSSSLDRKLEGKDYEPIENREIIRKLNKKIEIVLTSKKHIRRKQVKYIVEFINAILFSNYSINTIFRMSDSQISEFCNENNLKILYFIQPSKLKNIVKEIFEDEEIRKFIIENLVE